jgi:hypothetical protein
MACRQDGAYIIRVDLGQQAFGRALTEGCWQEPQEEQSAFRSTTST